MNNEQQLEQQKRNAVLAQQVLDNPMIKEFFLAYRADILDKFTGTKYKDTQERDELWRKMQTLDNFEKHFKHYVETGKLAEATLADKLKRQFKIA